MKPRNATPSTGLLAGIAVILFAIALIVDQGFAGPSLREVKRLAAERARLLDETAQLSQRDREAQELARHLGAGNLAGALAAQTQSDPLTYLGQELDRAHLTRLELATGASVGNGALRRTRYSLRVQGSYPHILAFLRTLERGTLLVTVDALSMAPVEESALLEGRVDLSIYSIAGGR